MFMHGMCIEERSSRVNEQLQVDIAPGRITKLGFERCQDCEWEPVCPHAGHREGCRTKENIMEVSVKYEQQ